MLIYFGVTPYLVFDGDNLPSKAATEADRSKRRAESRKLGLDLYNAGKVSQAHKELQKAVDVTPYMARQLIEELKRMNIPYVVAPYEADAQLAYLEQKGIINGVLSEDSDLLVFGVKRLLTKLDQHGDCVEISRDDFASCREVSFVGWTDAEFRRMAILSGCDYLPNINKMGLRTAYSYVRKYKNPEKILRMLQFEGQFSVPAGYLERYQQAELTFLHHRVFCPISKQLVLLNELTPSMKEWDMPYIGEIVDAETAIGVACGDLDPMTKRPILIKHVSTGKRAASYAPRRQTLASEADLKQTKSLDSFFKPRREPLAELDPNSLTPSPSQQRLLHVHSNASWEARTISSAPQLSRASTSVQGLGRSSKDVTRQHASFLERASTISTYQPPKRQRLCSENDDTQSSTEPSTSRFFGSNTEEPSPSVRIKKDKVKKAKNSDFGIYSDDSVDDILLGLPDGNDTVTYPKLDPMGDEWVEEDGSSGAPIFRAGNVRDETELVQESSPLKGPGDDHVPVLSTEASTISTSGPSQSNVSQVAGVTVVSPDEDPEAFEDLLELHVRMQNEALRKTFVVQSAANRADALRRLSVSPRKEQPSSTAGVADASLQPEQQRAEPTDTSFTPLTRTFTYQSSAQQNTALESLRRPQATHDKIVAGLTALAPTQKSIYTPASRTPLARMGLQALGKGNGYTGLPRPVEKSAPTTHKVAEEVPKSAVHQGSEDQIVPSSEDEGEDLEDGQTTPRLPDLSKYVFAPT